MFPCGGIGPPCICIGGCDPFPELQKKETQFPFFISEKVLKTDDKSWKKRNNHLLGCIIGPCGGC